MRKRLRFAYYPLSEMDILMFSSGYHYLLSRLFQPTCNGLSSLIHLILILLSVYIAGILNFGELRITLESFKKIATHKFWFILSGVWPGHWDFFKGPFKVISLCYQGWKILPRYAYISLGTLSKCRFWFSRSGVGLRVCISNKAPDHAGAAGPWTTYIMQYLG